MAARAQMAVGTAAWISAEKENAMQLLRQEKDELIYPAQHEMEWLNEHMAEIFSRTQFNVADVFKTPGKLRGKTPRTARKRNTPKSRVPLSDMFSSRTKPVAGPTRSPKPSTSVAAFVIAQDERPGREIEHLSEPPKQYTDSGYQGSTEDEMEVDVLVPIETKKKSPPETMNLDEPQQQGKSQDATNTTSAESRTTEGSFHSAKEEIAAKVSFAVSQPIEKNPTSNRDEGDPAEDFPKKCEEPDRSNDANEADDGQQKLDLGQELDDIGSPSDGSTPDRPLVRKSSLTFASLPAREPLTNKKSFGTRDSRTSHVDAARNGRSSYLSKQATITHATSSESHTTTTVSESPAGEDEREQLHMEDPDMKAAQAHQKLSTQRLHEKIDMLGKTQVPRPSKSIPSASVLAAANLRKSEAASKAEKESMVVPTAMDIGAEEVEEDDWIKPLGATDENSSRPQLTKSHTADVMDNIVSGEADEEDEMEFDMRAPELIAYEERMRTPARITPSPGKILPGFGQLKSASTVTLVSPGKAAMVGGSDHSKNISVSNPPFPSTTPKGSPRRIFEAPLSASRSKLQSIMKTAKGLFTSSAGVSAAAKMETLSPDALRVAASNMPGLYPNITDMLEEKPLPPSPPKDGRRTRSSTEREKEERKREKERRDREKTDSQLERARLAEKRNAAHFKASERDARAQQPRPVQPIRKSPRRPIHEYQGNEASVANNDMPPPSMPSLQGKAQRPAKTNREMAKNGRPQPMSIRVGSSLQRMPISTSSLASNLQETLMPAQAKPNMVTKKASNASLNSTTGNTSFKSSVTSQVGKPRALLAAERKKEADERETQRKLDLKRDTERKRAAQQEEARRQEQRQRAEAERQERERIAAEHAKKQAQQQAIEKRRQEQAKKLEQQRNANAVHEMASVSQNAPSATQRHEMGAARAPSRLGTAPTLNRSLISHNLPTNPAKPPKRPHEDDGPASRPQPPKFGAASQPGDSKRRRTDEEEAAIDPVSRPTISGAPIRQSNMGKKASAFPLGYTAAPSGPVNPSQNQHHPFPQPANGLRGAHPNDMSKYASGNKIPFAEAPNPPAHHHLPAHHKTPTSHQPHPPPPKSTLQLVKSSPLQPEPPAHHAHQYTPGETIALPDIPTDSEDSAEEDSADEGGGHGHSNGFPIPSWASPNTLTNQLIAQESVDGDAVFGPIAPLRMEEIFAKGNKDRLKKFRDRTSSANWAASGDGLTLEEVRADREMRERMRVQGGWRYGS